MILGDPDTAHAVGANRVTLDTMLHELAAREPDRLALADPPNRWSFTEGMPRQLSYQEADGVVSAIACRLRDLGLPTDGVIGLHLPNTVESVLAILGVLRAGMIAAPLPLLWRRADAVEALGGVGAKAIITTSRIGATDHGELAREIAADLFSIRQVCSFGQHVADGILPFDDLFDAQPFGPSPTERNGNPATHVAIVTWDLTTHGLIAVARNHNELIAGGHAVALEAGLSGYASILTPFPPTSFAGLALGVLPWLLCGGMLSLHQPFDPETFVAQSRHERCNTVVVPAPLLPRFAAAGLLAHDELRQVLALWRAPERLSSSPAWRRSEVRLTDVLAFGETGLVAARRAGDGRPSLIRFAPMPSPSDATDTATAAEMIRTEAATLALRGAMVPRHPFPPRVGFAGNTAATVDTGFTCRKEADGTMTVTGPPAGLFGVGGYRFVLRDLPNLIADAAPDASFAVLPDALTSNRLAGHATSAATVRKALSKRGANALIVDAFREPDQVAGRS